MAARTTELQVAVRLEDAAAERIVADTLRAVADGLRKAALTLETQADETVLGQWESPRPQGGDDGGAGTDTAG